jgi:myo-inositol-1(or 4)-monophosphatase
MLPAEFVCIKPQQIVDEVMVPAALAAGNLLIQEYSKRRFSVTQKSGQGDVVTEIDFKASALVRSILEGMCPDIYILDEEDNGTEQLNNVEVAFIVDPLDGTLNFVHGLTEFCVSIGLMCKGRPLAGVVYHPIQNTLFTGIDGIGSWKNGKEIRISQEKELNECLIGTGVPYDFNLREDGFLKPFKHLMNQVQEIRLLGSAALALCYVASGQLSAFYEYGLSPWDVAGGAAIILGSGGVVLPINNHSDPIFGGTIVAGNAKIGTILKNELSI